MSIGKFGDSYTFGPPPREVHRVRTSGTELLHLSVAFVVLTFDIALLQLRLGPAQFVTSPLDLTFAAAFGASATVTGFLAHELAHKVAAQRRGLWAEFRASVMGLVLSVVTAALGFLFAAPGATMVDGFGDVRAWGRISLSGPLVNLGFASAFLSASVWLRSFPGDHLLAGAFGLLAFFNGWFGAFNLIPFGPLDGRKVLRWSPMVWAVAFAAAAALAVVAYGYLFLGFF